MSTRSTPLPVIIVTGASGFIGRHFIEELKDRFYIYAFARRAQKTVRIANHKNIEWIRLDIAEADAVAQTIDEIAAKGGADFMLHLAGYYDFVNEDNPEFERTNVNGTRYILENCHKLNLKRFIFASSVVVTEYRGKKMTINEESPADANFPYARSKRIGEELVKEYSSKFPCAIVRFAAIFSDWCEYGPLYMFLSTWLSDTWNARMIAGKGNAAIPYLHVKCLNLTLSTIIFKTDQLDRCPTFIASPNGCVSQAELYKLAVRYNFGQTQTPLFIPKWLAYVGVIAKDFWGRLRGKRPFERPWMISYVDTALKIDSSATREQLGLKLRGRFHIKRRILYLIENKKTNPYEWQRKNLEAITKRVHSLPNLKIYETMLRREEECIEYLIRHFVDPAYKDLYPKYFRLEPDKLYNRIKHICQMLKIAVRTGDRMAVLTYAHKLGTEHFTEGFDFDEVAQAVDYMGIYLVGNLAADPALKGMKQRIHDEIMMSVQLIIDEMADAFEDYTGKHYETIRHKHVFPLYQPERKEES